MAVNKNFVVKNGLEVNSNLLVADLDTQTVGIGTTIAPHEFHVVGGIGVTNLNVTGVATIANLRVTGPSTFVGVTTFTDNNVFIDKQLFVNGISITGGSGGSIGTDLVVERHVRAGGIVTFSDSLFVGSGLGQSTGTSGQVLQVAGVSSGAYFGGQVGIGTTNPAGGGAGDVALHVVGDSRFVGLTTFTGITTFQSDVSVQGSLKVTGDITYDEITGRNLNISGLATFQSLTQNRVAIVGAGDTLNDTNDLRFADNDLSQLVLGVGATVGGGLTVAGVTVFDNDVEFKGVNGITSVSFDKSANALNFVDGAKATFGTGSDLTIDHDGSNTSLTNITGHIDITNTADDSDINLVTDNGSGGTSTYIKCDGSTGEVKLSYYGTQKLNTKSDGIHVQGEVETDSVGIADSIFHIGDDNTQIRFPAADTFTIETAGVERLRVLNNKTVGINTNAPDGILHVMDNGAGAVSAVSNSILTLENSGDSNLQFLTASGNSSAIVFGDAADNDIGKIEYEHSDNSLRVTTNTSEAVRVTSGGDVGIGTITPTGSHAVTASNEAVLAVGIVTAREYYGDGSNLSNLPATTTINNNADNRLITGSGTANTLEGEANLTFDGSQFAVVSGGATVGGALTVAGEGTFASTVGIAESIFHIGDTNTSFGFPAADTFTVDTGGSERLRIISDGRIGIGVTNPESFFANADNLVVGTGSGNNGITIFSGNAPTNEAALVFADGRNSSEPYIGRIVYRHDNDEIQFDSGGAERLRITSTGVGIGTTNPTANNAVDAANESVLAVGVVTARQYFGDGSNLSGLPQSGIGIRSDSTTIGFGVTFIDFIGSGIGTVTTDTNSGIATINVTGSSGGGGGVTETDTTVSTVNPTGVGSFATASFRSASVIAQINQLNTDYQVGRYLMIHDGTTVTVVEESAVSTGSTMLGSFTGVIDGSNVELRVTLASAGVSTVTTKIDTVTV
jgi:hypothetical protein